MIYFTADTHFDHYNIIKYCNRPFETVEEMNATLINNWNSVVGDQDLVYHLGDFAFVKNGWYGVERINEILYELKGEVHLIYGNHDKLDLVTHADFESVMKVTNIQHKGQKYILRHHPLNNWDAINNICWWLVAHTHTTHNINPPQINVGVDCWDLTPVSLDEISETIG